MRLLPFTTVSTLAFAACIASKSMNTASGVQRERNLATDTILIGIFESGDVDKLNAIIAPAFVNHAATGDRVGLDSLKTGVKAFHALMKSVKVDRKRQLADVQYTNTYRTGFASLGPTPKLSSREWK